MNPYTLIGSKLGTMEAASLSQRLTAWHDGMVAHERGLRAGRPGASCDDECAHGQARALWVEAVTTFGERAHELSFLRSRADEQAVDQALADSFPASKSGAVDARRSLQPFQLEWDA